MWPTSSSFVASTFAPVVAEMDMDDTDEEEGDENPGSDPEEEEGDAEDEERSDPVCKVGEVAEGSSIVTLFLAWTVCRP